MKKILTLVVCLLVLLAWTTVRADEVGFGGLIMDGHSKDNDYSVNDGWGLIGHFDKDGMRTQASENHAFGLDPGVLTMYFNWKKKEKDKTCDDFYRGYPIEKPIENDYQVTTTCTTCESTSTVHSQFLFGTLKPYWEINQNFRVFGKTGVGYEFADGAADGISLIGGGGLSYILYHNIGFSASVYEVLSNPTNNDERRYDVMAATEAIWWF